MDADKIKSQVQGYYGQNLQSNKDLQTNACCTIVNYPEHIKFALTNIHEEVLAKYYGCGLTIPTKLSQLKILDLGSGSGRDCYLLSQLVGEDGSVVGVDMTPEQVAVAHRHLDYHREKFNYKKSNVQFLEGDIQKLIDLDLQDNDFDLIISNCVINLVPNKEAVLKDAYRLLKEGGEFYFSDVYCQRRLPSFFAEDKEIWGECLGGAMYWNDFENLAKKVGFADPRVVESTEIEINNPHLEKKLAGFEFYSVTYRLFKIANLESHCEDYGQAVIYRGGVSEQPEIFTLDNHHLFHKGKVVTVCGNTYRMLNETRYRDHFEFIGNWEVHYGIFEGCGVANPFSATSGTITSSSETTPSCC